MNAHEPVQGTVTKTGLSDHLESWAEAFLVDRKASNKSPGTIAFYRKKLETWLRFCDTQVITQVGQITPDTIRRYLLWLETAGHNPGGRHACYRALKAFLNWFWIETDQVGASPAGKVQAPKVPFEPLAPVELDDVMRLIKTCGNDLLGARDRAIFYTLLDTGARATELLSLNLDDVDNTGTITIRQGKGTKTRSVFVSQDTRRAIRAYLKLRTDDSGVLFPNHENGRLTYDGLRAIVKRRATKAGFEPPTLHSFRRACAVWMHRNGVDLISIQLLLGHSSLAVIRRYLKLDTDDLRAAHQRGSPVENMKRRRQ